MTVLSHEHISPEFAATRGHTVETIEVDAEAVLVVGQGIALHQLNHNAALIWSCLDGEGTVHQLASEIAHAFEVSIDAVEPQVLETVRELGAKGLLEGIEPDDRHALPPPTQEASAPRFIGEPPSY